MSLAIIHLEEAVAWAEQHDAALWWLAASSAVLTLGTLLVMPWLVSSIPDDYFSTKERPSLVESSEHPVLRWLLRIGKNLLGLMLVIFGLLLSLPLVPGQGMIMALAGLLLLEFPGKRRLELWLIRRPGLLKAINWFRARRGRRPLIVWSPEPKRFLPTPSPAERRPRESIRH